jgi:sugar-specific transcriptional regulator TrmB
MFESLKKLGATIEEKFPGIYHVKGVIVFDTQIIVTRELDKKTHSSLRILSKNAQEEDARRFLEETESFNTQGDKDNAESILQVSVSANKELYKKLKEFDMCQALQELMKDEIDEKINESVVKAVDKAVGSNTERLNKLNAILIKDKRYDDLERSTEDKDFQNKLLDELVPKVANS